MDNPFATPKGNQNASTYLPSANGLLLAGGIGIALYLLRACAVLIYGLLLVQVPIGGPDIDAGQMVWIPFFIADLPWSFWFFDGVQFPSNAIALATYTLIVGLPWIAYGFLLTRLVRWAYRRINQVYFT
ncbi:hypothetical protein DTL42_07205 [Bremerella cremea]|uniref:Uncharacterized protein n=1 Tax=Bremerella cremea TaxID=1031537 RepID=A0A368KSH5_9BACT|nr:hypothetical protein [Bremerella cremea]RCS52620.1 hypothetical protein DTL42_07205 [Bremerella cremea]